MKKEYKSHVGDCEAIRLEQTVLDRDVTMSWEMTSTGVVSTFILNNAHPMLKAISVEDETKELLTFEPGWVAKKAGSDAKNKNIVSVSPRNIGDL